MLKIPNGAKARNLATDSRQKGGNIMRNKYILIALSAVAAVAAVVVAVSAGGS
jgi:hypothetical protein